jgi:hypothetical protein
MTTRAWDLQDPRGRSLDEVGATRGDIAGRQIPLELDATVREVDGELEIEAVTEADHRELGMTWSPLGILRGPSKLVVRGRLVRRQARPVMRAVTEELSIGPVPDGVDLATAGTAPLAGITAITAVDALLDLVNYTPGTYDAVLKRDARVASPTGAAGEAPAART